MILFFATILYGKFSGLLSSLNKKPKLSVRFIDKLTFYSFYFTGEKFKNEKLNTEFELHKTGFSVYMSIANIGNKPTSIDKIFLGYEKNKRNFPWFKKEIKWLAQWHPGEEFRIENSDGGFIVPNNLRVKVNALHTKDDDYLRVGQSIVGIAYFEQETAWGNLNPKQKKDRNISVIVKIRDIYKKEYEFKTELRQVSIEKARKFNPHYGNIEKLISR